MAIESREDLQRFIREHGRKATERELQSGDFGVSVGDIARDLYQPWAKEEALGISRGNPIAHQFGRSAQTALGRLGNLKAAVSPQLSSVGTDAFNEQMKRARVEAQLAAQKALPGITQGFRGSLEGLVRSRGNRQQAANLKGGTALGLTGTGLGRAGGLLTIPNPAYAITAPIGLALQGSGAGTSLAAQGAQAAETERIGEETQQGLSEAAELKAPTIQVDSLQALAPTLGRSGAFGGSRFNLTNDEGDTISERLRKLYQSPV